MTDLEQRVAAALHTVNENPGEGATLELAEDDAARKLIAALAAQGLAITGAPDAEYGTVRDWTGEPSTPSPLPSETPRSIAPDTEGAGHPEPVERGLDEQFYQRVRHALRRMTSTTLIPAGRVIYSGSINQFALQLHDALRAAPPSSVDDEGLRAALERLDDVARDLLDDLVWWSAGYGREARIRAVQEALGASAAALAASGSEGGE